MTNYIYIYNYLFNLLKILNIIQKTEKYEFFEN